MQSEDSRASVRTAHWRLLRRAQTLGTDAEPRHAADAPSNSRKSSSIGTHIRGASTTDALPVVVFDAERIAATGAVSGDDLLRSIPQMGDVLFEAANNPQTSNSARGDVNSVNLRSLGVGNTLVLLNGRRMVQHPTSQGTSDTGTVPVQSFNSNAIPVSGLDRVEVLLDGAAAIYGADAVAGVVNTVLRDDFDGMSVSTQYGGAEGTGLREFEVNLFGGHTLRARPRFRVSQLHRPHGARCRRSGVHRERRPASVLQAVPGLRNLDRARWPLVERAVGAADRPVRQPGDQTGHERR